MRLFTANAHLLRGGLTVCVLTALIAAGGCASKSPTPPGAHPAIKTQARQPASKKAAAIIRTAQAMLGIQYKWGGDSPYEGFDCSGFTWFVFHQNGITLPRVSWQQFGVGESVQYNELRPGDLIFHKVEKKGKTLHVGVVTNRGTFIHAPSSGKQVMESTLSNAYWKEHFVGARRVL